MELYLQFGHGMKKMAIDLSKKWNGSNIILSPRDIKVDKLESWSKELLAAGAKLYFDPQCYFPKSTHNNLVKYKYWDDSISTNVNSVESYSDILIKQINEYNEVANTIEFIIPSVMNKYDESWIKKWDYLSEQLIDSANKFVRNKKKLLTLAMPKEFLLQQEAVISEFILLCEKKKVDGFYIIAEPENKSGTIFIDNPLWMQNFMNIVGSLKLMDKKIIVGYTNQQHLMLSTAKVDAIATGTYLNVRQFSNKFETKDGIIKRKSVWYYHPDSLSEYKVSFLDAAYNLNVLDSLKPQKEFNNNYISSIFSGIMPSATKFNESYAFMHYLDSMKRQIEILSLQTYEKTLDINELVLISARNKINELEKNGIYGQARSFRDVIEVNLSGIRALNKSQGLKFKLDWNNI